MILRFLIDTDDKLPDNITLENVIISMTCIIKNDIKLHPQLNKNVKKI